MPEAHTLVWERDGVPAAYLRFRLRDRLEVPECGAVDDGGIDAILRLLRRLAREHARPLLDLALPPTHPVARALFGRGGSLERNNLGGGCTLCVKDWPGLIGDVAQSFAPAVELAPGRAISLNIEGKPETSIPCAFFSSAFNVCS